MKKTRTMTWSKNNRYRWWTVAGLILAVWLVAFGLQAAEGPVVNLRIEGSKSTLFVGQVEVGDCVITDTIGAEHTKEGVAACGLLSAAEGNGWTVEFVDYGWGLFLNGIGDDVTPADYSATWSFWVNNEPASVGVDSYKVQDGDDILLAWSGYPAVPLRVTSEQVVTVGEEWTATVEKLTGDWDESFVWHGQWERATGSRLHVGETTYEVGNDGTVVVRMSEVGQWPVWATGEGLIRSAKSSVTVKEKVLVSPTVLPTVSPTVVPQVSVIPTPTVAISPVPTPAVPTVTPTAVPSLTPQVSVIPTPTVAISPVPTPAVSITPALSNYVTSDELAEKARRGLGYLRARQSLAGDIDGQMVSAWSAIAFGSANVSARDVVKDGGKTLVMALTQADLLKATDVERQILAVRAAGENPKDFNGNDLISWLKGYELAGQIGEADLVNDDIFGILALLTVDDVVGGGTIEGVVNYVLRKQVSDGSWGNIDMTAAAVQALEAYKKDGGSQEVSAAIVRAKRFLRASQDEQGGFGNNSATTAWVIQAIIASGEDPNDWVTDSGKNPWQALLGYQNDNGGFGWQSSDDPSAFMTAYAVAALSRQPWPVRLLPVMERTTEESVDTEEESGDFAEEVNSGFNEQKVGQVAGLSDRRDGQDNVPGNKTMGEQKEAIERAKLERPEREGREEQRQQDKVVKEEIGQTVAGAIRPSERDRQFAIIWFGFMNAGIGFAISRIFVKLW